MTSIFGCSFGPSGWQHLVCTLREYDADPTRSWQSTTLYAFHKNFKPRGICELAGAECDLPLFVYPWGGANRNLGRKDVRASRFCGPSDDAFIEQEYERLIVLYEQLRRTGYRPRRQGNSFVSGTLLVNGDGDYRFIVLQGNHRVAALTVLGYEQVRIRFMPGRILPLVRRVELSDWPAVASGACSASDAERVFSLFFEQDGHHVRRSLTRVPSSQDKWR